MRTQVSAAPTFARVICFGLAVVVLTLLSPQTRADPPMLNDCEGMRCPIEFLLCEDDGMGTLTCWYIVDNCDPPSDSSAFPFASPLGEDDLGCSNCGPYCYEASFAAARSSPSLPPVPGKQLPEAQPQARATMEAEPAQVQLPPSDMRTPTNRYLHLEGLPRSTRHDELEFGPPGPNTTKIREELYQVAIAGQEQPIAVKIAIVDAKLGDRETRRFGVGSEVLHDDPTSLPQLKAVRLAPNFFQAELIDENGTSFPVSILTRNQGG